MTSHPGAGSDVASAELPSEIWMLQSEAAATAGCSVSAIRKWRRLGLVAERTRVSPGGMRRVEVRLEDVLNRMRHSMPPPPVDPDLADITPAPIAVVTVGDLDVFVQHIAEAERRAAQAEARSQAKDALIQFLRQRVADLEAQAQGSTPPPTEDLARLAGEIRDLRSRFQRSRPDNNAQNAARQAAIRLSYDTSLLCLCLVAGIQTNVKLGQALTSPERTRLAHALEQAGLDISG